MSSTGNTTVPSSTDVPSPESPETRTVPALALAWSAHHPENVGEVALFDDVSISEWILGRDGATAADPAPRATFVRQRPGQNLAGGLLAGNSISRRQLCIRRVPGGLEITNLAEPKLLIDGRPVAPTVPHRIKPGAVVQILGNSVFLLIERPLVLPLPPCDLGPLHAFGEPDAHGIVGESPAVWAFRAATASAVKTGGHVLIHGPTGTGKELAANAIHRLSGRTGHLIAYNAATLTPSLADSILFGNGAGYPNPGMPERSGLVGAARYGTLFLDEIGELPIEVQASLLRTMEGEYTRQGESKPRPTELVVVAATNRDLSSVKHDVLRRFAFVVETPSLAVRPEDLPLLVRSLVLLEARGKPELAAQFVRPEAGVRPEVDVAAAFILALFRTTHEGNLRDLRNLLLRAMTETRTPPLMPSPHWTPSLPAPAAHEAQDAQELLDGMWRSDEPRSKEAVRTHLVRHGWQIEKAAKSLGVDRHALRRLMVKHDIQRPDGT